MTLKLSPQTKITMLDPEFVQTINAIIRSSTDIQNGQGVIINFRDPEYSAERGGYHPLELSISTNGDLLYLTDFSFAGMPPFVELGIELDWNFEMNSFRQFDNMYDLECGRSLLGLYLANFTAYYKSGVYQVEVTTL